MEAFVVGGDRLAQRGQAHHRRILVPAGQHGLGGRATHILRAGVVGKTLAEIDRLVMTGQPRHGLEDRSEEHTSELQTLMRISYAVFCLTKKTLQQQQHKSTKQKTQTAYKPHKPPKR